MFKKALGAAVLVLAVLATVGSASDEDGEGSSGGGSSPTTVSSGGGSETTAAPAGGETTAAGGGSSEAGEADEVDDVTIASCGKDETIGFAQAELTVVNNSSGASNYSIEIAFESPDGATQIGTGVAFITGLGPEQTKNETVSSLEDPGDQEFICRIASVDRFAA